MGSRNLTESSFSYLKELSTGANEILRSVAVSLLKMSDTFRDMLPKGLFGRFAVRDHDTDFVFVTEERSEEQSYTVEEYAETLTEISDETYGEISEVQAEASEAVSADIQISEMTEEITEIFEEVHGEETVYGDTPRTGEDLQDYTEPESTEVRASDMFDFLPPMSEPQRRVPAKGEEVQVYVETEVPEVITITEEDTILTHVNIDIEETAVTPEDIDFSELEFEEDIKELLVGLYGHEINVTIDYESFKVKLHAEEVVEEIHMSVPFNPINVFIDLGEPVRSAEVVEIPVEIHTEEGVIEEIVADTPTELFVDVSPEEPLSEVSIEIHTEEGITEEDVVADIFSKLGEAVGVAALLSMHSNVPINPINVVIDESGLKAPRAVISDFLTEETEKVDTLANDVAEIITDDQESLSDALTSDMLTAFEELDAQESEAVIIVEETDMISPVGPAEAKAVADGGIGFSFMSGASSASSEAMISFTWGHAHEEAIEIVSEETETMVHAESAYGVPAVSAASFLV